MALDTLMDMEQKGRLSHLAMGEALMQMQFASRQDRAFFTRLCEGVTERRIYLDYVLDSFSKTKMSKCRPLIRNLLRLSAYQILFMNVRDAAACNEAVAIAKKRGFHRLSGFVNGVLRAVSRGKDDIVLPDGKADPLGCLSVRYSMPKELLSLFLEQYGEETTKKICGAFLETRPMSIRTCLSKIAPEALEESLRESGVLVEKGSYLPYAFHISGFNYLSKLPAFREGMFLVQDESSMLPVEVAHIREGESVLDLCAAPGGKTFHAADAVGERGQVLARDLTDAKIELLEENKDRLGYPQVKIERWDATRWDAGLEGKMDVVLADLPCSGLGIIGRKNDIRYHMDKKQMGELAALQREMLSVAWRYVKPGGRLIFSTCTLNRGENEDNVRWIEENTPLRAVSIEDRLPQPLRGRTGERGYLQLIPGVDGCDGFFVSKFIRK